MELFLVFCENGSGLLTPRSGMVSASAHLVYAGKEKRELTDNLEVNKPKKGGKKGRQKER
jgi:hypothetical protein